MNAVDVATNVIAPATEVSILGMFMNAHLVVKLVILGLLSASVWCQLHGFAGPH